MTRTSKHRPWLETYRALGIPWDVLPELPAKSLATYVEEHARDRGDRIAIVYLGRTWSYAALDALANRFAHVLRARGFRRGDVLGIHLPNTPQYVLAFVAASKLGVTVTSLSPLMTPPELLHQANDARVRAILSLEPAFEAALRPVLDRIPTLEQVYVSSPTELLPDAEAASPRAPVGSGVTVSGLSEALAGAATTRVATAPHPDDVVFLQYTGGTTGRPKGAQLTLRNVLLNNLQADVFNQYRVGEEVIAAAFPMFHIGGAAVTYNALRAGATSLVIPDPRNVEHFCAEMRAHPPTILINVPALYQMLLASPAFRALDFDRLRLAVTAAAPFSVDELRRLEEVIGEGKITEVYGMTETGPIQTCNPAPRFKLGHVGIPVPGTDVRIVDVETGTRDVPLGEAGEIIVRGPQVMRGYLDPEGTKHALRELDGETWMYTGDVGIMDDEGYVRICDRNKDMLIVGGYKVFSVEVEHAVKALPFVALSALVGRPDPARPGSEIARLVVQRMPGAALADDEAREAILRHCRANLAPYKIPKEIIFVDALPLTSVGKIDKKAMRAEAAATSP
ncbi:MAG: AMP-binding protein [Polyangiales bacterium]